MAPVAILNPAFVTTSPSTRTLPWAISSEAWLRDRASPSVGSTRSRRSDGSPHCPTDASITVPLLCRLVVAALQLGEEFFSELVVAQRTLIERLRFDHFDATEQAIALVSAGCIMLTHTIMLSPSADIAESMLGCAADELSASGLRRVRPEPAARRSRDPRPRSRRSLRATD